ncbi:MAG: bacteriohemerythrin [Anaerolineae bacterium]|nr:bacteriohemerythrin [Anaerolineae bacterium]MDW8102851.1 bacteriohemerythrin [Anaerolineae bacterium]
MKIQWTEELSVGVPQMDEQHKRWIEILNEFYDAVERGEREEGIRKLFQGVEEYTSFHFNAEEQFMAEIGYPDLEDHRKTHQHLKEEVLSARKRYDQGDQKAARELVAFVISWLYTHIAKTDKKYGEYYASRQQR